MTSTSTSPSPSPSAPAERLVPTAMGRDFEDFQVGDVYRHWPGRTITESDNVWFTLLTMNPHPLHFDHEYGSRTPFGRTLVNSTLTMAMVTGMSVRDTSWKTIANLGWDAVRLSAPVFVGDTIYARSRVLEARLSRSREGEGVVRVATEGRKGTPDGEVFLTFERAFLAPCRGYAVGDSLAGGVGS